MKKLLSSLLVVVMIMVSSVALVSCGKKKKETTPEETPTPVVLTAYDKLYSVYNNISVAETEYKMTAAIKTKENSEENTETQTNYFLAKTESGILLKKLKTEKQISLENYSNKQINYLEFVKFEDKSAIKVFYNENSFNKYDIVVKSSISDITKESYTAEGLVYDVLSIYNGYDLEYTNKSLSESTNAEAITTYSFAYKFDNADVSKTVTANINVSDGKVVSYVEEQKYSETKTIITSVEFDYESEFLGIDTDGYNLENYDIEDFVSLADFGETNVKISSNYKKSNYSGGIVEIEKQTITNLLSVEKIEKLLVTENNVSKKYVETQKVSTNNTVVIKDYDVYGNTYSQDIVSEVDYSDYKLNEHFNSAIIKANELKLMAVVVQGFYFNFAVDSESNFVINIKMNYKEFVTESEVSVAEISIKIKDLKIIAVSSKDANYSKNLQENYDVSYEYETAVVNFDTTNYVLE